jgi:hypothetical protein
LVGRTFFLYLGVKNIPAGGYLKDPLKTRQGKAFLMDEVGDMSYLRYIKLRVL